MRQIFKYERFDIIVTDEHCEEFEEISHEMAIDQRHPLWKNYYDVKVSDFDAVSITMMNGKPVCFNGSMTKDIWNGAARAMSRTYLCQAGRPYYKEIGFENTKLYVSHYHMTNNRPYFISRQVMRNIPVDWRSFMSFTEWMRGTGLPIRYTNRLYKMGTNENVPESWQYIFWITPEKTEIESITSEEWESRFIINRN